LNTGIDTEAGPTKIFRTTIIISPSFASQPLSSHTSQECIAQTDGGETEDQTRLNSEARVLRIVKVLRILKIIRILKAFKVVE
jgi:hypothetical protein